MSGFARVQILGRCGNKPEMKTTGGGTSVCTFSLATSTKIKGEEKTHWHKIVALAKNADICCQYLDKGTQVHIDGELQTNEWTDKEGNKRITTEVLVRPFGVQLLGSGISKHTEDGQGEDLF